MRIFQKIDTLLHVNESKVSPKAFAIYDPLTPPAIFFESAAKATPHLSMSRGIHALVRDVP